MKYQDAQLLAAQFGAKPFRGDHAAATYACWQDRILYLPVAAQRGREALEAAIAEADRYA